jgi:hypothetical protein
MEGLSHTLENVGAGDEDSQLKLYSWGPTCADQESGLKGGDVK